jgi:hypothetical protein
VFCTAPEPTAMVDGQRLPVEPRVVDDHIEFRSAGWQPKHYRRLRWGYRVANAFALARAEPSLIAKREDYPHLHDGWEVWSHRVQFDYDRLTLEFVLDAPDGDYFGSAGGVPTIAPIVERRANGGPLPWERLGSEEARATKLLPSTRRCSVSWPSPMADARYGLMFPLASAGDPLPLRFAVATARLVQRCRSTRRLGDGLRTTLATYLEAALKSALELGDDESFGENAVAVGNLWSEDDLLLRPCFGFFPPDAWVTQFDAGRGIAGHAFRFGRPAAWHRSIAGEYDVIRVPTLPGTRDYEWILCLPILTSPDGAAIGVFGFAGARDPHTEVTNQLAAFAQQIAQREPSADTSFDRFWYVLNASFWYGLVDAASSSLLDRSVIDMAEECRAAFLTASDVNDADD